ncbi:MAG: helix-turn-helix domain-containing protein [Lachnospiraceae bacterium]
MKILIWKVRTTKNVSLRQLSKLTGISKSTLNNYENGMTIPDILSLELVAKALDCRIQDLYDSDYK